MITKSTVLILGAGVSMPYGFPAGSTLVEQICAATIPDIVSSKKGMAISLEMDAISQVFIERFGKNATQAFGEALYYSQKPSIDSFLEHRSEFLEIGKFAIALFILDKEINKSLFNFDNRSKGCYQYIFNTLNTSWHEFAENKISFITFNYDRSLEQYLITSLENTYGKPQHECAELLSKIPIIHVYGSLGALSEKESAFVPYGAGLIKEVLSNQSQGISLCASAATQIKIITEGQQNTNEFQKAFSITSEAEKIYFLGFGYNQANLSRLRVVDLVEKKYLNHSLAGIKYSFIKGTGYNLEDNEIKSIQEKWFIHIPDHISDSLTFLRRHALLD